MDGQPSSPITDGMFEEVEAQDPRAENAGHFPTNVLVIAITVHRTGRRSGRTPA